MRWLVIVLILPLAACEPSDAPANGAALYRRYCASCHGKNGRGDGPVSGALVPRPIDLTTYRASLPDLMQAIDGRHSVRAHGTSAMPVWGQVFEQMHLDDAHAQRLALLQVEALADYVARLSGKAAREQR